MPNFWLHFLRYLFTNFFYAKILNFATNNYRGLNIEKVQNECWHRTLRRVENVIFSWRLHKLLCIAFYVTTVTSECVMYVRLVLFICINVSGINLQDREDNSMTVRVNAKLLSIEVLLVERHSSASGEIKSNVWVRSLGTSIKEFFRAALQAGRAIGVLLALINLRRRRRMEIVRTVR